MINFIKEYWVILSFAGSILIGLAIFIFYMIQAVKCSLRNDILSIYEYGYYRNTPNKKYIEFDFRYTCKDKSINCITKSSTMYSTISSDRDYNIIWAYTDGETIYELSSGVSIGFNDNFVFLPGEKRIIGVIK